MFLCKIVAVLLLFSSFSMGACSRNAPAVPSLASPGPPPVQVIPDSPAITQPSPSPELKETEAWKEIPAPPGVIVSGAQWIEVGAPLGRKIHAAIFRPREEGTFPAVIVFHGTMGFRNIHLQLARSLTEGGFIAIAGCWFRGHYSGVEQITPATYPDAIPCSYGPDIKPGGSPAAARDAMPLVDAARTLPGVRSDRLGLLGHSRGSVLALNVASSGGKVQAVVAVAGYPQPSQVRDPSAPVLIIQGTADRVVPAQRAREYEKALTGLGSTVEAKYYEGAPHVLPFVSPTGEEVQRRAIEFFQKYLQLP